MLTAAIWTQNLLDEVNRVVRTTRTSRLACGVATLVLAFWMPVVTHAAGDFASWWPKFQAAVAAHVGKQTARGAKFPMSWENGAVRQIQTAADFAGRFDVYLTPEIRNAIAKVKPQQLPNGNYVVTWKARGNEYSLYFVPLGNGYALDGLSEGPP